MSDIRLPIPEAEPDKGGRGGRPAQATEVPCACGPAQQELSPVEWYSQEVSDVRGSES